MKKGLRELEIIHLIYLGMKIHPGYDNLQCSLFFPKVYIQKCISNNYFHDHYSYASHSDFLNYLILDFIPFFYFSKVSWASFSSKIDPLYWELYHYYFQWNYIHQTTNKLPLLSSSFKQAISSHMFLIH